MDAILATLATLDNMKASCHALGSEPIASLAVVAPRPISVPTRLDGVAVIRVDTEEEARKKALTRPITDLVELEVIGDKFLCVYERLLDRPNLGGHTMVYWHVVRESDNSLCMRVHRETIALAPAFGT